MMSSNEMIITEETEPMEKEHTKRGSQDENENNGHIAYENAKQKPPEENGSSSLETSPPPMYMEGITGEVEDMAVTIIDEDHPIDYRNLATFVCIINFLFGIIALNMAFKSLHAHRMGNIGSAKRSSRNAFICSLVGIVVTFVIVCVTVYVAARNSATMEYA